ncbi:D-mandelate dehydrogenase [Yamadazyma tenuis]|nr:D-mandelate dehydrogenase [Yamadazyma tenuis]
MTIKKPRILYVPCDQEVHDDQAWKTVYENFEIVVYDFDTIEDYMNELKKPDHGKIGFIDAVFRPTWLKGSPYLEHYILRGEPVRLLPKSVKLCVQSGHGYDIVDIDYLSSRNIIFCNSPDCCSRATADVGTLLVLNSFRYASFAENCVRTRNYYASMDFSTLADDPEGHTLGIIGLGDIGKLVAKSCQSFGMKTIYHNRTQRRELEAEFPEDSMVFYPDFDEFLAHTDCILVMCPYTEKTKHMISFDTFKRMKIQVRIVNIARGPIVQEEAIIDALERGQLVGGGFDVHEFEPKIHEKLLSDWRITLLPHWGAVSRASWKKFERNCVQNMMDYFYGDGKPKTAVNKQLFE